MNRGGPAGFREKMRSGGNCITHGKIRCIYMRKRKNNRLRIAGFAMALALLISGCGGAEGQVSGSSGENVQNSSDEAVTRDVFAMDTYMSVTAYGPHAEDAVHAAVEEIRSIDDMLSTGNEDSEVSRINRDGGGTLSEDGCALLKRSLELYEETDGKFDISIYPIMQLWGFPDQNYRVPSKKEIRETLKLVDASEIRFDEASGKVSFGKDGMEIDFGGIAKGYTSAKVMEIFREYGVASGLVNLGGNVETLGEKPDGSDWKVGIRGTEEGEEEDYLGILTTHDKAVITSGGYERYFEKNGKRYHHIIDPDTGYPADSGIVSSTVVSADGTLADGLSTSLFIMGPEEAEKFWRGHSGEFDFILLKDDGTLLVTEGIADSFESDRKVKVVRADG